MKRTLAIVAVVVALATFAAAQSATTAPTTPIEALLEEVRALRADIQRNSSASIRAQLLVARLQLQEQRINSAARDLAEVQTQIAALAQLKAGISMQMQSFAGDLSALTPAQLRDVGPMAQVLKAQLAQQEQREQALRQQEILLTGLISEDQVRWSDFNNRLDNLERDLTTEVGR